ncbi:MAG: hypothetical protein WCQ32_02040 [bacterium]
MTCQAYHYLGRTTTSQKGLAQINLTYKKSVSYKINSWLLLLLPLFAIVKKSLLAFDIFILFILPIHFIILNRVSKKFSDSEVKQEILLILEDQKKHSNKLKSYIEKHDKYFKILGSFLKLISIVLIIVSILLFIYLIRNIK